jgi:hypothetical protein
MTGTLALPAGFGADAAVLMVAGVPVALVGAQAAEVGASLQHLYHQGRSGGSPPGQDRPGARAGISAIEIETDAAGELGGIPLGEAGVGAGYAGLGAVEAGFYALNQSVIGDSGGFGMAGQHLAHAHAVLSCGDTA